MNKWALIERDFQSELGRKANKVFPNNTVWEWKNKLQRHLKIIEYSIFELFEKKSIRNFDAKQWVEKKCTMFNDYMRSCGLKAAW